ncbi:MAG: YceI family protein [Myxococcaceae bacterium]|nr:MAG: YceI family protein [Myxococcaceae bacterium]
MGRRVPDLEGSDAIRHRSPNLTMKPFLHPRRLSLLAFSLLLTIGGLVKAGVDGPSGAAVRFSMQGTAGLRVEGVTHELLLTKRDGNLVFRVPLAGLDTGIGLRNRHMRGYLDVTNFPDAELHVTRKGVALPSPGKTVESDTRGTFTLHGISRPCSIHYRVEQGQPGEYRVHGTTRIDIRDFGIEVPAWGVRVDPSVGIEVDFTSGDL